MAVSVFDLFSVGIGPSSSHTVGPMRAALTFVTGLTADGQLERTARVHVELFGSLGATGRGHGSDKAVVLGLEGERPETVDTASVGDRYAAVRAAERICLLGRHEVGFGADDLVLNRRVSLPYHPNGMRFTAYDAAGAVVRERTYYSVGGVSSSMRPKPVPPGSSPTPPSSAIPSTPGWNCSNAVPRPGGRSAQ